MSGASRVNAIALLVAGAFFMENLDGTVIVTALPEMARSFGVAPVDLNIGVSAYLLTLAMLIPVSGWVADRFGARNVFAAAIVIFTVASILCGLSQSLGMFTAARILQGAGGAMMVPVGRLIVLNTTPKEDLIRTIATITWPALVAPVLGPPVGGFITTFASWHWIFFLNVPLGLIGLAFAWRLIPTGDGGSARPFDGIGFVLTGLACFGLMYGLELVSHRNAAWPIALAWLIGGLVIAVAAVRHARRAAHPMIDLWALRLPTFAVTIWGGSLFRMAINAVPFLLPLMFQIGFGYDAFEAGLLVLAVFAGNLTMKLVTTRVLRLFRFRTVLLVNGLLNAATLFACAFMTPATPYAVIVVLLFLSGLTRSMQFTALNTIAFADVPQLRMSGANTLFNVVQQMAMGLGIALGAAALRLAGVFRAEPADVTALVDFRIAFVVVACVALLAVVDVVGLSRAAGDTVRAAGAR